MGVWAWDGGGVEARVCAWARGGEGGWEGGGGGIWARVSEEGGRGGRSTCAMMPT